MHRDPFDVRRWRSAALASDLTPAVKVLLVVLADSMNSNGQVSVPRHVLADRCGCSERQVSERFEQAVERRFLDSVSTGKRGHTAVYAALRQTADSARQNRPLSRGKRAVLPDAFVTVEPPAFSVPLSVAGEGMRAVEPPTSSKHAGTARGRAADSTEARNDGKNADHPDREQSRRLRAVGSAS